MSFVRSAIVRVAGTPIKKRHYKCCSAEFFSKGVCRYDW
ncbi:MAG: hypothetical protein OFPII_00860 [Osedax symbiont Rs1]|nr:MAG: hypothetical protein OFPII_00860 [Osedax symbiont Rs1]